MRGILLTIAIVSAGLLAHAQTTQRLTASKTNEYGLIYTLPQTAVDIAVEIELTVKKPGEFHNYAKRYLNIDNPTTALSYSVKVLSATIGSHGVKGADDQQWLVQFKAGTSPFIIIGDTGAPLAVNTDQTYPVETLTVPTARPAAPTPLETDAARQAITPEMIQSQSLSKRAELAAARIYELRQARTDIISGQSDQSFPDGKALQLALDNLAAQEAALTAMFIGTVSTSTQVETFTLTPDDKEGFSDMVLTRISSVRGFVPANDLSGAPIYLTMSVDRRGELPVNEKGIEKTFPKGGLAYTIPGVATFTLRYDGRTLAKRTLDMAQLGVTFGIDPTVFTDKKAPLAAIFDPMTGALRSLEPVNR